MKNEELETNILIKNRVFSIIANDLKTPVVNLTMLIENLMNISDEEKRINLKEEIIKQVDFTVNLIENLIIWGRGQQKQVDYRPGRWNVTDIVLECFNLLNTQAEMKYVQLSYSHRGSPFAWCDRYLLSVIMRNLLSNAIKFTPDRGRIDVTVEEIADVNPHVKVTVRDSGVGMDKETLENLEKNRITDSTMGTRGEKGTGIGLQLCYHLIMINKGSMQIESTRGEGTSVSFTLPLKA